MAILIDPPLWPAHGRRWSHLASDSSVRELHAFAARLGIPERGFEGDHYDVPEERYAQAVRAGAIPVSTRELLRRLQSSGLRRVKRRGERVVASRRDEVAGYRVDAVLSAKPPLGLVVRVHAVLVHGGHVLVVDDGEGYRLPSAEVRPGARAGPAAETSADPAGPGARSGAGPAWEIGWELADALVGAGRAGGPAQQVGYLRRVRQGRTTPVDFELVLRWPDAAPRAGDPRAVLALPPVRPSTPTGVGGPGAQVADPGILQWVPVHRAVVLLPVDLAPVALNEHHRLRPPGMEEPGPLNPEVR
jgi:hypothetical protein